MAQRCADVEDYQGVGQLRQQAVGVQEGLVRRMHRRPGQGGQRLDGRPWDEAEQADRKDADQGLAETMAQPVSGMPIMTT